MPRTEIIAGIGELAEIFDWEVILGGCTGVFVSGMPTTEFSIYNVDLESLL